MKKIYLAGPDVFLPNAKEIGARLKNICRLCGFEGLYPLDNEKTTKEEVVRGDLELLDAADYVVANCNNFRGKEMDSGTAFEIGYAVSKGKPVFCYCEDLRPQKIKYGEINNGFITEDFDSPLNIMISETCTVCSSFIDALNSIKKVERTQKFKNAEHEFTDDQIGAFIFFTSVLVSEGLTFDFCDDAFIIQDAQSSIMTVLLCPMLCKTLDQVNKLIDVYHSISYGQDILQALHSEFMNNELKTIDVESFYKLGKIIINMSKDKFYTRLKRFYNKAGKSVDFPNAA